MKQIILIFLAAVMLSSCGNSNQSKAVSDAMQVQSELKKMETGNTTTAEAGWLMKAKIAGHNWSTNSIKPLELTGRIIGDDNITSISLPYDRRSMVLGNKTKFSHDNGVDLMTNDDIAIWGAYSGEMEITKVDGDWVEGKFFFTATAHDTDKKLEVTDGFFRISLSKK